MSCRGNSPTSASAPVENAVENAGERIPIECQGTCSVSRMWPVRAYREISEQICTFQTGMILTGDLQRVSVLCR